VKRIVTPKYVEHVTMNIYVKDSQILVDLSTLSATGKAQKGKNFFVDLLMSATTGLHHMPVIAYMAIVALTLLKVTWSS